MSHHPAAGICSGSRAVRPRFSVAVFMGSEVADIASVGMPLSGAANPLSAGRGAYSARHRTYCTTPCCLRDTVLPASYTRFITTENASLRREGSRVHVGTAAWANPPRERQQRGPVSHLAHYSKT